MLEMSWLPLFFLFFFFADFYAPPEYLISTSIRDKLAPIKLGRYGEDLLFYLYYTNCGDILQLAAAAEL